MNIQTLLHSRYATPLIVTLLFAFLPRLLLAGEDIPLPPTTPPDAEAAPVQGVSPVLDGNVLGDPAWAVAEPITDFWQTTPDEGRPATERTEVRIVYDAATLYIGVVCFDRSPEGIIVSDSRRDAKLDETDSFQIIFDTYLDRQNGFVFGTNPAGIEYDGQVSKEGQGGEGGPGRQMSGSGSGFNLNWDAAWNVRTLTGEFGWSAEFAIPFRTLRYRKGDTQTWGLNFQRNIRRRNESSFWAPLPRQFNLYRLSLAGTLNGLQITRQRNLQVTPYVLGQVRQHGDDQNTNWTGDFGADLKYNITPSLTLDGTYNTDFAQVEVDEQQINLDRFNLFFPEKRPFFLENAGFFSVGAPGEVDLFFSRRIGIGAGGRLIPILGGTRLSGKIGESTNVGLLTMQTESVDGVAPSNNFSVVRMSRELPNRSSIGGILVNRQGSGDLMGTSSYNRTYGFDGKWGVGEYTEFSGFLAGTSTPGLSGDSHAFKFGTRYDSPAWTLGANYTEVGENFNPEVGFLQREGFRKVDWTILRRIRPDNFIGIHELRPHASFRGYWDFEGFMETGFLHLDNHWEWKSGAEVHTGMNLTKEGVLVPFEIFPGVWVPTGTYDHTEAQLVAFSNEGAWISARIQTVLGGFFGGTRVATTPSMRMRLGDRFNTEVSWGRNDIDLPGGEFVTNLSTARITYSFTPRVMVQSLIQYNDRADIWSVNFRFTWLQEANTGLFIVYNDTRGLEWSEFPGDRSLIIKFSKLFDLLN